MNLRIFESTVLLVLAGGCAPTNTDASGQRYPMGWFEGRTFVDGEALEPQAVVVNGQTLHHFPTEGPCDDVWWVSLELGSAATPWSTWVNVYSLSEFEAGLTVPLQDVGTKLGSWTAPLLIVDKGTDPPSYDAMRGGHAVIERWTPEDISVRLEGGEWCERPDGASPWECTENRHTVVVERRQIQEGCCDFVIEDASCYLAAPPAEDWILVEGTGRFCSAVPGSTCPDS